MTLTFKQITILTSSFAILGLISLILGEVLSTQSELMNDFLVALRPVNFSFPYGADTLREFGETIFGRMNGDPFHYFMHLAFLIAAILYGVTKGREVRLIRFFYALVLFVSAFDFFCALFLLSGFGILVSVLFKGLYLALGYFMLKTLNASKELETYTDIYGNETVTRYCEASTGERFLNNVFDTIVIMGLFAPVMVAIQDDNDSLFAILGASLLLNFMFYFVFELLFHVTPGKYLTESRVVSVYDEPLTTESIFIRTASRFIPFEPVAFFLNNRWHDELSNTDVVKEEQSGVSGNKYAMGFLLIICLCFGGYWGAKTVSDKKQKVLIENFKSEMPDLEYKAQMYSFNHLGVEDRIVLKNMNTFEYISAKIDSVAGDSLVCIDHYYYSDEPEYRLPVSKQDLLLFIQNKKSNKHSETIITINGIEYEIRGFICNDIPLLEYESGEISENSVSLFFNKNQYSSGISPLGYEVVKGDIAMREEYDYESNSTFRVPDIETTNLFGPMRIDIAFNGKVSGEYEIKLYYFSGYVDQRTPKVMLLKGVGDQAVLIPYEE